MSFGDQLKKRREELGLSRSELADRLGVSRSAVGNYETGVSAPKEEVLLRLFDALHVEPNYLYRDAYRGGGEGVSDEERSLLEKYRRLGLSGRQTLHTVADALGTMQQELQAAAPEPAPRVIPLYCSPAAAGYAAPVFGEDYEPLPVTGEVPTGAELAVRIQGDSMEPYIHDGSVVYVNHDPLRAGDVGIFCVDGAMLCKQYHRDALGMTYLFSLNRARADADVITDVDRAQHLRARADQHIVAQRRMALAGVLAGAAQGHAVVDRAVVTDLGGLAKHDAHAVVDKQLAADLRAGVDLDAS